MCPIVGGVPTRAPTRRARGAIHTDIMRAANAMNLRDLRRGIRFETMAAGVLFVAFAVLAMLMPAQNDTWWHLRAGQEIWRTHQIPRVDHYSHTFVGAPWPAHQWLRPGPTS